MILPLAREKAVKVDLQDAALDEGGCRSIGDRVRSEHRRFADLRYDGIAGLGFDRRQQSLLDLIGIHARKHPRWVSNRDVEVETADAGTPRIATRHGDRRFNGAAAFVTKHHEQRRVQVDGRILKRAHVAEAFTKYRKTHNEGVFDAYTADVRRCRSSHILTGLPDAYGRGRIIGDYRRVALYGVNRLIEHKEEEKRSLDAELSTDEIVRDREELSEQIRALKELRKMAANYGFDISGPAGSAREAVQWLYFGYLAGVKEQNGAAMSLGRTSTFLDIYFERDLVSGRLTEEQAQEIIDDFVIKLRIVRFLRTPEYDELFAGDPTWVTESIAGMPTDTKKSPSRMS